ncbi:hypothetical protein DDP54_09535 [Cellulomonas sp. WB94]|uniref:hypothetical protein n=1 Tax=Cellulomonas sp. WB94 TaxID=2173174 RepID=UPI000D5692A0|nr:hypothetical protein [Cellulomonas sp. WB94]PVU83198.1 hypothetical protein DDP54_09535 [Cellulomonas sp. WB94]
MPNGTGIDSTELQTPSTDTEVSLPSPTLRAWVGRTRASWVRPSWRRSLSRCSIAGAVGDMLTTSAVGHVDGIREANPLSAAGQALLGSTPGYMVVTTVVVAGLVTVLAVRPVDVPTRVLWWALALLGAAKIVITILNLVVLQGAIDATVDVF